MKKRYIPAALWLSALKRMHGISYRNLSYDNQVRPERVPDGAIPMNSLDCHVTPHLHAEVSAPADAFAGRSMQEPAPSFQGEGACSQPECKAASTERKGAEGRKSCLALHITIA